MQARAAATFDGKSVDEAFTSGGVDGTGGGEPGGVGDGVGPTGGWVGSTGSAMMMQYTGAGSALSSQLQ
jgi:hypothetical protein